MFKNKCRLGYIFLFWLLCLFGLLGCTTIVYGQANLVLNPGFEDYFHCPDAISQLSACKNWLNPTLGTPDYFNFCSSQAANPLQNEYFGYQWPRTGNGMAGFGAYLIDYNVKEYREYLSGSLSAPMVAGQNYRVRFFVSLANIDTIDGPDFPAAKTNASVTDIGIFFSLTPANDLSSYANLTYSPQVINPSTRPLNDTAGWMKIEGNYKATGGEKYLTIGNFESDYATNITIYGQKHHATLAYYFVDDVSVIRQGTMQQKDIVYMCNNQPTIIKGSLHDPTAIWNNNNTGDSIIVDRPGKYWNIIVNDGDTITDTVVVISDTLFLPGIKPVFELCQGQTYKINLPKNGSYYTWSNHTNTDTFTINKPGKYYVNAVRRGCIVTDTITALYDSAIVSGLPKDSVICKGSKLVLDVSDIRGDVKWQDGSNTKKYEINKPGIYTLSAKNACGVNMSTINISGLSLKDSIAIPDSMHICLGIVHVLRMAANGTQYIWNRNDTSTQFIINKPGVYNVTASRKGCSASDTFTVFYDSAITFKLHEDTTLCYGQIMILDVSHINRPVQWRDGSTSNKMEVSGAGLYVVSTKNACGTFSDSIKVGLHHCDCFLYIPNSFTPLDRDQWNDTFKAIGNCNTTGYIMNIYNRWGELIYESRDINQGWDGCFKNNLCPEGIYLYSVKYKYIDTPWQLKSGTLTILK